MFRKFILCPLLLLLVGLPFPIRAQDAGGPDLSQPLPIDPKVLIGTLDNGLRYYIRANSQPQNQAQFRLVVNAGTALEDEDQRGLAHFVEHMAFRGTTNFPGRGVVDFLETLGGQWGADVNAYTNQDETVYRLQAPTEVDTVLDRAVLVLSDWAQNITFNDEDIEAERPILIQEWLLRQNDLNRQIFQEIYRTTFQGSRYAERLKIFEKAVLDTFAHDTLRRYYRDWYRPDLMAVIAVGDFDVAAMEAKIQQHFSGLSVPETAPERPEFSVPLPSGTHFAIVSNPEFSANKILMGYNRHRRERRTIEDYRQAILDAFLVPGMIGRRLEALAAGQSAPFLSGFSYLASSWPRPVQPYVMEAVVAPNGVDAGFEALLTEAERVRRFGFGQGELEREKSAVLSLFERNFNERDNTDSGQFADECIRHFLRHEPIPGIEYEYDLVQTLMSEITVSDVNATAEAWLNAESQTVVVGSQKGPGIQVPTEADLQAVIERVGQKEITPLEDVIADRPLIETPPEPGSVVSETTIPELEVTEWELSNGVRVVLKPTTFQNDEILFTSFSPGGSSLASDEDYVAAITAADIVLRSGLGEFSIPDLENWRADKTVGITPLISSLREGISGHAAPKDLESMFQLIYLAFTAPREDSLAFQAYRSSLRGQIESYSASAEQAFGDTLRVTLAQHHPRARPFTLDVLNEMDLHKSLAFYRDRFADAGDFTFIFVGNFNQEQIRPLVETYLGGLPATGREETWRDEGIRPPTGVIEKSLREGNDPLSHTRIAFTGPLEWTLQDRVELTALVYLLRINILETLRAELGGVYTPTVDLIASQYPEPSYRIDIAFRSNPENVGLLTEASFALADSLKTRGPRDADLAKVRAQLALGLQIGLQNNGLLLSALQSAYINGEDPRTILTFGGLLETLTVETLQQAAARYLNTDNYVRVVLHPLSFGQGANADFNGDDRVDFQDFLLFAQHFDTAQTDPNFDPTFDLTGDGAVNFQDFIQFAQRFGKPAASAKPGVHLIPPDSSNQPGVSVDSAGIPGYSDRQTDMFPGVPLIRK